MGSSVRSLLAAAAPVVGTLLGGPLGGAIGGAAGGALNGGGLKGALLGGATGGIGAELAPAVGNVFSGAFPETAASLGISGDSNTLTDLLGQTTGGSSWNPGGGLGNLLSGNGVASLTSNGSPSSLSISAPSNSGVGTGSGLTGEFANGIANNSPSFSSLASPALSAGTGGGGSAFSSLLNSGNGINLGAALLGGANSLNANNQAQKDLLKSQQNSMNLLQPYLGSGAAANARLSDLLGTSGNTSAAGYGTLGGTFSPGDLTKDPGYQFQLEQGNQALDRQQASKGSYFSGGALKAAQDYGQGLADQTYNNAYQRWLQQQQQTYGEYAGQAGAGANAANAGGNIYTNIGNAQANAGISSANITNQTLSNLLSGSGAKRPVNLNGQIIYV